MAGQNFYADQDLRDISNLSRMQSGQALTYGDQAAAYADPFRNERPLYQNKLRALVENPGSIESSPYYKFAYDQGLNALQRKGDVRSGNKLAALMRYGQDYASQAYFPQAQMLSNLAISGSSPASAGLSYARGAERSQDYQQMAAASKAAANRAPVQAAPQTPWWMQPSSPAPSSTGLPSGGSGYYTPSELAGAGYYGGYTPSSYAGSFNISSGDTFGGYDPTTDPYWSDYNSMPSFDSYDYGDYGDF